jgi:hypothetical protein
LEPGYSLDVCFLVNAFPQETKGATCTALCYIPTA